MWELEAEHNVVRFKVLELRIKVGKVMHSVALPCAGRIEPFIAEKCHEILTYVYHKKHYE